MSVEDLEADATEERFAQAPPQPPAPPRPPANTEPGPSSPPTIADLLARFRGEVADLPEPLRKAVADLVSDYLKTPDAETGQAVAAAIERLIDRKPP